MDLIYTDKLWRERGIITEGVFDLAYGSNENDFKLTIRKKIEDITQGSLLFIEGTDFGGVVDKIGYNDENEEIYYEGRSWSGILDSKVIIPDPNSTYSGYVLPAGLLFQYAIVQLLEHIGAINNAGKQRTYKEDSITYNWSFDLLVDENVESIAVEDNYVDPEDGQSHTEYENLYLFKEYETAYAGICEFIKSIGIILTFSVSRKVVDNFTICVPNLVFKKATDWTQKEELDKYTLPITGTHLLNKTNHFIGLGNRITYRQQRVKVHVYLKEDGTLTTDENEKYYTGIDEIIKVEDFGNVESSACAVEAMKKMKEISEEDEFKLNLDASFSSHPYYVGDVIGRRDEILFDGDWIKRNVTKKIAKLEDDNLIIEYEIGGDPI